MRELQSMKEAAEEEKRDRRIEKELRRKYEKQQRQLEEQLEQGLLPLDEKRHQQCEL